MYSDIFDKLDILVNKSKSITESLSKDDRRDDFKTREQGEKAAIEQIVSRLFSGGGGTPPPPPPPPGGGGGEVDDDPFKKPTKKGKKGGGSGEGPYKSHKFDDFDDGLDGLGDEDDEDTDDTEKPEPEEKDFEFDDFDYEDKDPSSGKGGDDGDDKGSGGSSSGGESADGDEDGDDEFGDEELDEDDYDFGDGEDGEGEDGEDGEGTDEGDTKGKGGSKGKSGKSGDDEGDGEDGESGDGEDGKGGSKGSTRDKDSDSKGGKPTERSKTPDGDKDDGGINSSGDIDYDDTVDYDTKEDDSLEGSMKDALERTKEGASKSEKDLLDGMKDTLEKEGDIAENADKLKSEIEKAKDESKVGKGELPGETLDEIPSDEEFEKEMKKAGFSDKDIRDMKKSKNTDPSSKIDEDKITKEAIKEMDKKVKDKDLDSSSSLSTTIMRSVLDHKVSNMEWKEMVKLFLGQISKTIGTYGKTKGTAWGHKNHLWRDAIMPKTIETSGSAGVIYCFIDFSGSVNETLVKIFLRKVLSMCEKLVFDVVKVYGFGNVLSKPYDLKKSEIGKTESEIEKSINKMWNYIDRQYLGGNYENFEEVAIEIARIKRKEKKAPILIFGDGKWALSYPNKYPPKYLKEYCESYLKDILVLVYYHYENKTIRNEMGYLRHIVGLEHIVTTKIDELK